MLFVRQALADQTKLEQLCSNALLMFLSSLFVYWFAVFFEMELGHHFGNIIGFTRFIRNLLRAFAKTIAASSWRIRFRRSLKDILLLFFSQRFSRIFFLVQCRLLIPVITAVEMLFYFLWHRDFLFLLPAHVSDYTARMYQALLIMFVVDCFFARFKIILASISCTSYLPGWMYGVQIFASMVRSLSNFKWPIWSFKAQFLVHYSGIFSLLTRRYWLHHRIFNQLYTQMFWILSSRLQKKLMIPSIIMQDLNMMQSNLHQWGANNFVTFDAQKESKHIISKHKPVGEDFRILGCLFDCKLTISACIHETVTTIN